MNIKIDLVLHLLFIHNPLNQGLKQETTRKAQESLDSFYS